MKSEASTTPQLQTFLLGHAQSPDWETAAEQCLQQIGYIPAEANLAFVYCTDGYAEQLQDILNHLREETGIAHWVGTVGIGICASGKEYYETGAMAVMITGFPEDSFRILPIIQDHRQAQLETLKPWLAQHSHHFGIIHGDPTSPATGEIIDLLPAHIPGAFLVGGLTSSRDLNPQIADDISANGVSGVLFSENVPVATALTQGCKPISVKHEITQCERNVLVSLDGRPALEVFNEDIGEILSRDLNRIAGYIFAGLTIPGSDTGDYLVRNLMGVDETNKLLAIGEHLHVGQTLQFCRRDGASAWEDMQRMLDDLGGRINGPPRGGVYYSCLGRGQQLFGDDSEELRAIRKTLGDFPLVGFFANGEISHNRLYGYTGVLTLFL